MDWAVSTPQLWMYETVVPLGSASGMFLDVGSYIGACTFHMASLGMTLAYLSALISCGIAPFRPLFSHG